MFVWRRRALVLVFVLCLMLSVNCFAVHEEDEFHKKMEDLAFSVLILGDSQMAGSGWKGGYANCIQETFPNARVVNLAQGGSLLVSGDIFAQWEYYLSQDVRMPEIILLDGGINDLSYMKSEEYRENGLSLVTEAFCFLIEDIHERSPDTQIIYTTMPPLEEWDDPEKGPPSYEIQQIFWKYMNITANKYNYVTVLDLFSLNPFHFPCVECYCENFVDSIHLNESGYRNTFGYVCSILETSLTK